MNSQDRPHTSPLRASYGASFLGSLKKRYREISRVYCNLTVVHLPTGYVMPPETQPVPMGLAGDSAGQTNIRVYKNKSFEKM